MIVSKSSWSLEEREFKEDRIRYFETIFSLGNGYIGSRATVEEGYRLRRPGTFLAGLYDRAKLEVSELPNLPDWTSVEVELGGERLDLLSGKVLAYSRRLDLKEGMLRRTVRWQSPGGRITTVSFERFISLASKHLLALRISIRPENWSSHIVITSSIDGQVTNQGTQHFACLEQSTFGERGIYLILETLESGHIVSMAANHRVVGSIGSETFRNASRRVDYRVDLEVQEGEECCLEKLVSVHSSRDKDTTGRLGCRDSKAICQASQTLSLEAEAVGYDVLAEEHRGAWRDRWKNADILISGSDSDQLAIRFAIFHLIQMTPWDDPSISVAAKGLSGEGYRGHVFWDTEIFILPFFVYSFPEIARNLLLYRYYTLPGACRKAREYGYQGAMYAWESAATGDEETPKWGGIDPVTRKPNRIWTGEQEQHITADVAYAVWQYFRATSDRQFMIEYGAEILCLTARFWASRVSYNEYDRCYEIRQVIGPDEYKENVNNNYFTNRMVQWNLRTAVEICRLLQSWGKYDELAGRIALSKEEQENWFQIANRIKLPRKGNLLLQCDGFLELEDIDISSYRKRDGGLHEHLGWERITHSQVLKQADVLMLLHLLGNEYSLEEKEANWRFYEPRTMHDSSLSAAIHSTLAASIGRVDEAYGYFLRAAAIDLEDSHGNTEAGLHAASLGGLWQAVVFGFAGISTEHDGLVINPRLPKKWKSVKFCLNIRGNLLEMCVARDRVLVRRRVRGEEISMRVFDKELAFSDTEQLEVTI